MRLCLACSSVRLDAVSVSRPSMYNSNHATRSVVRGVDAQKYFVRVALTYIRRFVYVFATKMKTTENVQPAFLFKTLCDPTRLRLLNLLASGETCVCELTDTLRVVQPKVSRHLAHLKRAGLVEARRDGKWMHYRCATRADSLVRHVLTGLREWMAADHAMSGERRKRDTVCCRISRRKTRGRQSK